MNWLAKAAAYKTLSALPGGAALYRLIQERVTQSLVPTRERVSQKIEVGLKYFDWLANNGLDGRLIKGVHLDFGAGWHPTIPLLYYCLGAGEQHLLDVAANLNEPMLAQTITAFLAVVTGPEWPHRAKLGRLPAPPGNSEWRPYLERMGISYHVFSAHIGVTLARTVDVVTCTQVFPYVSRSGVPGCLSQIHASLKPGGLFLATAYLRDVLAGNPYRSEGKYNHLKYSPDKWDRWFNSSIMQFNQFKARDYREMLEKVGLEVVHTEVEPATAEDYAELDRIRIAPCFKHYTREELGARALFFVARKP